MATKAQLEALAKGREKLAKSRKLNGIKDFFKKKKEKPVAKKTTVKKSSKKQASTKKLLQKKGLAGNSKAETIKMLEKRLKHQQSEVFDAELHYGEAGYPKEYAERMIANCKQTQKLLKQYKSK